MKVPASADSAIAIWLAATLAACSSSTHTSASTPAAGASSSPATTSTAPASTAPASTAPASPASSAPAPTGVPVGYQRVGGSAQGVSFAVPSSWAAVNL